ncbi:MULTISPECIES: hypothetical protein [unclassified Pseudomonas]|uniref:hypothetical protein n=1 Tax=unclassified Pseudomonas TaxID=196821 RepID=UPI000F574E70|nr:MULTISPECIES: hypothetical protein [unclassified Pseudomonas]
MASKSDSELTQHSYRIRCNGEKNRKLLASVLSFIAMLSLFVPVTYAAEPTAVNPDPFGGPDKRPEKSENVMTVWNEDGTFTTSVVMTYGDGHKEHCIIKTVQST